MWRYIFLEIVQGSEEIQNENIALLPAWVLNKWRNSKCKDTVKILFYRRGQDEAWGTHVVGQCSGRWTPHPMWIRPVPGEVEENMCSISRSFPGRGMMREARALQTSYFSLTYQSCTSLFITGRRGWIGDRIMGTKRPGTLKRKLSPHSEQEQVKSALPWT